MSKTFKIYYACLIGSLGIVSFGVHLNSGLDRTPVLVPVVVGQLDAVGYLPLK